MARQRTTLQNLKSIALAVLVALGLVILFAQLDGPAAQYTHLLGPAAREALEVLPSAVPVAWQAFQAFTFDHQRFSPCTLQMLVSFWPLLHVLAAAA
jgi:hypothetical protein